MLLILAHISPRPRPGWGPGLWKANGVWVLWILGVGRLLQKGRYESLYAVDKGIPSKIAPRTKFLWFPFNTPVLNLHFAVLFVDRNTDSLRCLHFLTFLLLSFSTKGMHITVCILRKCAITAEGAPYLQGTELICVTASNSSKDQIYFGCLCLWLHLIYRIILSNNVWIRVALGRVLSR